MSKTYKYITQPGQNLIDVSMQHFGSVESIVELCLDNNLDVGQDISAGTELTIDEAHIVDKRLVAYYKSNNTIVASE